MDPSSPDPRENFHPCASQLRLDGECSGAFPFSLIAFIREQDKKDAENVSE